jgi:hypothetical protein
MLLFSLAFSQLDAPSTEMSVEDEILDVDEKGRFGAKTDKKILSNMLFVYGQIRQTAEGGLKLLQSVSDFALKSFDVLIRVENITKTAIKIKEDFKEYKNVFKSTKNPFKLIDNVVSHTYNNMIVNGTDMMWLESAGMMEDLAELNDARQNIAVATKNIASVWDIGRDTSITIEAKTDAEGNVTYDTTKSIWLKQEGEYQTVQDYQADSSRSKASKAMTKLSVNLRSQSIMATQAVNMTDPRMIAKYEFNPNMKRKGATAEVMSSALANTKVRKQQHETNYLQLRYAMSMASDGAGDETSITATGAAEVLGAENALLSTYIEHENLNDFIKVMGAMSLNNMEELTKDVHGKVNLVTSANRLAIIAKEKHYEYRKK